MMKSLVLRVTCLIPSDNAHVDAADLQRPFQDAEPEILVAPNKRFVGEILDGKKK